jgi:pimeloyl-ACP methyl ester carboxylesterase
MIAFQDIRVGQLRGRAYRTAGVALHTGTVFVLLHGIGMSHRYFRRLHAALDAVGDTYALDLPGFGATPQPRRALTVEEYARFTGHMLRRLGITSCVLVGHSMGVQFAVELARQQPSLASHLVLIGPVVDAGRRTVVQQAIALARDSLGESPSTNAIVFTDYLRCGPRRYLIELAAMMDYRTEQKIGQVHAPVLVMRGARDPIAGRQWCRLLVERAPSAELAEVHGGYHVVQESRPERVLEYIRQFVAAPGELRDG